MVSKLNDSLVLLESALQVSGSVIPRAGAVNPAPAHRCLWVSPLRFSELSSYPHPWYDSDWVILVACVVITLGAVYFLTKRDGDDDDRHGDGPGSTSSSGITSSRGLLDLLSSQDALSSDLSWWGFWGRRRFAANPGYGESSVRLFTKRFTVFPYGFLHLISCFVSRLGSANRLFSVTYSAFALFALCCIKSSWWIPC